MWVIAKYDRKKIKFFLEELKKKFNDEVVIYNPRVKFEKFHKKKIISKEFNILGDYIFCYNPKFKNQQGAQRKELSTSVPRTKSTSKQKRNCHMNSIVHK